MRAETAFNARLGRAAAIVMTCQIQPQPDGSWLVESQTTPQRFYRVQDTCTCPDVWRAADGLCKHRLAVAIVAHIQQSAAPATA